MFNKPRLIALSLSLMFFGIAGEAIGQVLGQPHRLDDKQVEQIIHRVENQANAFRKSLDESLDKSRLDGTKREDDINAFIKEFDKETARLHDHFDNHKSAGADVEAVLDRAVRIDEFMSRHSLTERPQNEWRTLKANLDELAQAYNVSWRWNAYSPIGSPVSEAPYRPNDKEVDRSSTGLRSSRISFARVWIRLWIRAALMAPSERTTSMPSSKPFMKRRSDSTISLTVASRRQLTCSLYSIAQPVSINSCGAIR